MTQTPKEIAAEVIKTFDDSITAINAMDETCNNVVLAWGNGLFVGHAANGHAYATGLSNATQYPAAFSYPAFFNGHEERAVATFVDHAIRNERNRLLDCRREIHATLTEKGLLSD